MRLIVRCSSHHFVFGFFGKVTTRETVKSVGHFPDVYIRLSNLFSCLQVLSPRHFISSAGTNEYVKGRSIHQAARRRSLRGAACRRRANGRQSDSPRSACRAPVVHAAGPVLVAVAEEAVVGASEHGCQRLRARAGSDV